MFRHQLQPTGDAANATLHPRAVSTARRFAVQTESIRPAHACGAIRAHARAFGWLVNVSHHQVVQAWLVWAEKVYTCTRRGVPFWGISCDEGTPHQRIWGGNRSYRPSSWESHRRYADSVGTKPQQARTRRQKATRSKPLRTNVQVTQDSPGPAQHKDAHQFSMQKQTTIMHHHHTCHQYCTLCLELPDQLSHSILNQYCTLCPYF